MVTHRSRAHWLWSLLAALLLCTQTLPVAADGGLVLPDSSLWARLSEEQQIAVIRLESTQRAQVDLFISMLDATGESHEVTFFVPLGAQSSDFAVKEEPNTLFESTLTYRLDEALRDEASRASYLRRNLRLSLFFGTLFINGGWSWPLWLTWMLSGCAALGGPVPMATFETESSQVAIYGTDAATDLEALIVTTGLDPAVRQTLEHLRGQQIAIVHLRTQAQGAAAGAGPSRGAGEQPGLHLHWATGLISAAEGPTYRYPLGTGGAWAQPISVTRVYIVAPSGLDFTVRYPALGEDLSGYTGGELYGRYTPHIMGVKRPAYAVDEQVSQSGHIWRVTYLKSNAIEDLVITAVDGLTPATAAKLRQLSHERTLLALTWPVSVLVALALWVVAWKLIMARVLSIELSWDDPRLWREALSWALLYPLSNALAGALCLALMAVTIGLGSVVAIPVMAVVALGGVSLFLFVRRRSKREGLPHGKAALAYVLVAGATNLAYLAYALIVAAALGVL